MLKNLNLKQKISILAIIIMLCIIAGVIIFNLQSREETVVNLNELLPQEENTQENVENVVEESENKIVVHIAGEVKKPGIITLNEGARIADAISLAGGTTKQANLDEINLAYKLEDGQKIYIPNIKEKNTVNTYVTSQNGQSSISSANNIENKKININKASKDQLETLPGVGSAIASRIIEYRNENGNFKNIEDLKNVKGIGEAKYDGLKDLITVK